MGDRRVWEVHDSQDYGGGPLGVTGSRRITGRLEEKHSTLFNLQLSDFEDSDQRLIAT